MNIFNETTFIYICDEYLKIKLFKKYWFNGGSYWNKKHINKNNINNLKSIISLSNNTIKWHIIGIIVEIPLHIDLYYQTNNRISIIISFIYHSYAFIVQNYNKIMAQKRINIVELLKHV